MVQLKIKIFIIFLLSSLVYIGVFPFSALASTNDAGDFSAAHAEVVNINTSWVDDDLLRIDVMFDEGEISSVVIRLSDYIGAGNNAPFIEIQAVDSEGSQWGVVKISNPLYPDGLPITNAVEENDLPAEKISEAEDAIPASTPDTQPMQSVPPEQDSTPPPEAEDAPSQPEAETAPSQSSINVGPIIFIIIMLAAAGGAAYYFLFYKRRNQYEDADDESEDTMVYGYADDADNDSEADEMYDDENPVEEDDE